MGQPYTGGCACGALRYEARNEPIFQNHCQCRDCQLRSGTGHGSYLTFAERSTVALAGEAGEWRVAAGNGNVKTHGFCRRCGTPVYLTFAAMPDYIAVHAGSLDDAGRFRPQVVTYGRSGHGWDARDPALPVFERMPPGEAAAA